MIQSIHLSRGLAAVAVAVYHTYLLILQKTGIPVFEGVSKLGYLGVPYFFVLSGFIIAFAHGKDINKPATLGIYASKRFIRVYPAYWLFSLIYVGAALVGLGEPEFSWAPIHVFENIALVHVTPDFNGPPLKVGWTLFYELRFYALFALAIWNLRFALLIGAAWLGATIAFEPINDFTRELLSFWSFAFLFGAGGYTAYRRVNARYWPIITAVGLALVATIFAGDALDLKDKRSWLIFPISLGFAAIMLGIAMAEKARPLNIGAIGRKLGDASYSIYLVHSAVISVAVILVKKSKVAAYLPYEFIFFLILTAAVVGGVIAHELVEKPLLAAIKRVYPGFAQSLTHSPSLVCEATRATDQRTH